MNRLHLSLASAALAFSIAACIDTPPEDLDPQARLIVAWDPLDCGEPHRIAVELEDDAGYPASTSTWCDKGSVTLDIRHFGMYSGRVYSWSQGSIRNELPMRLAIDQPIIRWYIPTPQ